MLNITETTDTIEINGRILLRAISHKHSTFVENRALLYSVEVAGQFEEMLNIYVNFDLHFEKKKY